MTTNARDKAALQLAIDTALADSDPETRRQVRDKLANRRQWGTWEETAQFCAYSCQVDSLGLLPWEKPPCLSDGVGDEPHDILYRRLKAAGISVYHPNPLEALAAEV